jgi:hypothetical protein
MDRTGGSGGVGAGRRPFSFPGKSSPSRTSWPWNRNGSGRNTGCRCRRLWRGPGWANGGAGSVAGRPLPTERRGGAAGVSEGRVRSRGGLGGGSLFHGLILQNLVAALDELLRLLERPRVDQVPDVARQLVEKEDGLYLLHCGRLQGSELVSHDGGPGVAAHRVVQPLTRHLGDAEAVGAERMSCSSWYGSR